MILQSDDRYSTKDPSNGVKSSTSLVYPPADGSVTLPEVFDFHNAHQPGYTMFTYKADGATAPTNISFFEFRRAADRVAHYIRPGRRGPEGEVIAVIALSDTLLYQTVSVGLTRAGVVPYMMSPRNTAEAVIKMLKETSCHKLITTQETLKSLLAEMKLGLSAVSEPEYALEVIEMPPLAGIFPKMGAETAQDNFEEYPKAPTRPKLDQTVMYLHSSGSTGLPKSIRQSFLEICNWADMAGIRERQEQTIGAMALPSFHMLGFSAQVLRSAYRFCRVAIYPPIADSPSKLPVMPTPDNILEHARRTGCEDLTAMPALILVWAQHKESIDYLTSLQYVAYSGGPLPSQIGRQLVDAGVKILSVYGGTEFGPPAYALRQPRTSNSENPWEYKTFDENLNIHFEPQGDGTYELQFLRHNTKHDLPVENMTRNGVRGYATSDLWIPHPCEPGFWKLMGRKDDVIIHSSGEKTVPAPMENIICQSRYVIGAVMFGRAHDQPGVLIELDQTFAFDPHDEAQVAKARTVIWPVIEQANAIAPAFSRLYKEFILFSNPNKPLPRAGKGTVMRKAALKAYDDEIEALYASVSEAAGTGNNSPPASWSVEAVSHWIIEQLKDIYPVLTFTEHGDLFDQGLDSLSATVLRRRIFTALKSDTSTASVGDVINQNTIYSHPTVHDLAVFVSSSVKPPSGSIRIIRDPALRIENMVAKYSHGLEELIHGTKSLPAPHTVLLTGSTGSLGSAILERLLLDPEVERVYALNRSSSKGALEKHKERFEDKGFDVMLLGSDKLTFIEGNASDDNLGLPNELYETVREKVTVIIHNAWRLNFNLSLTSFESNIRSTRHLIDLGRVSPYGAQVRFIFTSSISQSFSWDTLNGPYPEEVVTDARSAVGMGYGESKYVSERILSMSGLRATSLRIGQIAGGAPNGAWATSDWVPIMVKSSIALRALPSQAGTASWIPMDAVAQALLDVALTSSHDPDRALNIVHPQPIAFDSLMAQINDALVSSGIIQCPLSIIPLSQWSALLEARALNATNAEVERIPAIKLLDFFRSAAHADTALRAGTLNGIQGGKRQTAFSTSKSQAASKTMADLAPIDVHHARSWVRYWQETMLF